MHPPTQNSHGQGTSRKF